MSGAYLEAFSSLPDEILWSLAKIEASLAATLESRPSDGEIWLFGYGSLIWNPLFEFDAAAVGVLCGWHRSFCLRAIVGRGCAETPGRMLSLEPGGTASGVTLQLPRDRAKDELRMIWIREMATGAYAPIWADVGVANKKIIRSLVFVAQPSHPHHEFDSEISHIAPLIAAATGPMGTNADYVHRLRSALEHHKISDPYIEKLAAELKRLQK